MYECPCILQGNLKQSAKLTVGGDVGSTIDMSFGQNNSVMKMTSLTKLEKQADEQIFRSVCKEMPCC